MDTCALQEEWKDSPGSQNRSHEKLAKTSFDQATLIQQCKNTAQQRQELEEQLAKLYQVSISCMCVCLTCTQKLEI